MRILFVNPKGHADTERWMPLGATMVATLLARKHQVAFRDCEKSGKWNIKRADVEGYDTLCLTGMSHQRDGISLKCPEKKYRLKAKLSIVRLAEICQRVLRHTINRYSICWCTS